jgi:hypothetical protein
MARSIRAKGDPMGRLDIGEALSEGFKLVGRRPLDVMAWGLAYFLFGLLPIFAIFWWMSGDWIEWVRHFESHPDMTNPWQLFAEQMKFQAIQPVMALCGIVGRTLVYSAVFRAVLAPKDRGFLYLRFGKAELWLALVLLVQGVCIFLTVLGLMFPVALLWIPTIVAAHQSSFGGWEVPLGVLGVLAAMVVFVWLLIRFSMAAPMTVAERQFRLFESWRLTRGHTLGLFALYLITAIVVGCVTVVVEMVVAAIVFTVLAGVGFDTSSMESFFHRDPQAVIAVIAPWAIGACLVFSVVGGVLMALFLAPWARAYAQLTRPREIL